MGQRQGEKARQRVPRGLRKSCSTLLFDCAVVERELERRATAGRAMGAGWASIGICSAIESALVCADSPGLKLGSWRTGIEGSSDEVSIGGAPVALRRSGPDGKATVGEGIGAGCSNAVFAAGSNASTARFGELAGW